MSTRAIFTFKDEHEAFHVYKHHDGYPEGACAAIVAAFTKAWHLPRFEADEFAAAFVAANKPDGGGIRLLQSGSWRKVAPQDIEYRYEITVKDERLFVMGWQVSCDWQTNKWSQSRAFNHDVAASVRAALADHS